MADSPDVVMQRLHDDHAGALWGHCLRLTNHDRARAEDVCQETLLRAWRNASLLDETQGSVRAWLFTVARNIVIDESRTRRARSEIPMGELPDPASTTDGSDELLMTWVVADAVTRLSPEHRAVLQETYFKGRPVPEARLPLRITQRNETTRTNSARNAQRLGMEVMGVVA
jgi:RNA polymerase sigma-70 factor (ECF subfamily)